MSKVIIREQQGAVLTIRLNRPDAMNSFVPELCQELLQAFEYAHDNAGVRVVVLTGEGRSFSAGADLKSGLTPDVSVQDRLQNEYRPLFVAIAKMPKPVIAAVGGSVAGIGTSLALTCDLLIMADDAFMLSPFATISLVPDGGMNWQFVRQLGYRRAYQLAVECERIDAARCVQFGLANKAVPADELQASALAWAAELSERAPLALAATKRVMRHAMDASWESAYDLEAQLQDSLRQSADAAEGVQAFLQKRPPKYQGK